MCSLTHRSLLNMYRHMMIVVKDVTCASTLALDESTLIGFSEHTMRGVAEVTIFPVVFGMPLHILVSPLL
jgi:hypothetical protein